MSQELAPTFSDGFLLSSWGLGSGTEVLRLTALSVIFAEELLRLSSPALFRALNFVLMCIPLPNIFGGAAVEDDFGFGVGPDGAVGTSDPEAPIVPEEYVAFTDDRKAKKGDENDVYMLQTHGFNKHRFNSRSFLKRNKLTGEEEGGEMSRVKAKGRGKGKGKGKGKGEGKRRR